MGNCLLLFLGLVADKSAQIRVEPNEELINSVLTMHWVLCWGDAEEEAVEAVDVAVPGSW